ncbi:hypothetical protein [Tissierella carlieri]|nr:hypothetical protein [Tissierella carlieri]
MRRLQNIILFLNSRCANFKLLEEKCLEYPVCLETLKEVATTIDEELEQ